MIGAAVGACQHEGVVGARDRRTARPRFCDNLNDTHRGTTMDAEQRDQKQPEADNNSAHERLAEPGAKTQDRAPSPSLLGAATATFGAPMVQRKIERRLQRKPAEPKPGDGDKGNPQATPEYFTITDTHSWIRTAPPAVKSTGTSIP